MNKRNNVLFAVLCIVLFFCMHNTYAQSENQSKKLRIGYFQSGKYYEYTDQLRAIIKALMQHKLIAKKNIPVDGDARQLWSWLSKNIESDSIEFIEDAFWDNEWNDNNREINKKNIYEKTVNKEFIDFMIVMGTDAGQDISRIDGYKINTMVIYSANPVKSKIVKDYDFSGIEHIYAITEKELFLNEIDLFYRLIKFKKLGMVYMDTPNQKVYAALEDARTIEKKRGFQLITRTVPETDKEQYKNILIEKYTELFEKEKVDAIYIQYSPLEEKTPYDLEILKELVDLIFKYNVKSWSQTPRTWMVKYGVLMSLEGSAPDLGRFAADAMIQILKGKKPGSIKQSFVNPKNESIVLNVEAAQRIEFDLKWDILAAAGEIHQKILEKNNP